MERRPRALTGVKPTGRVHLGNLEGALRGLALLQDRCELFCLIANWHAFTTEAQSADEVAEHARQIAIDCLAVGLDPARTTIFLQSDVPEHAELYLALSLLTPVSWLERVPTYKDVLATQKIALPTHGLLGYPVLQAADILLYRAELVPVGRDQLPHLELTREIARRFQQRFGALFPEPKPLLSDAHILPGLDGRKMSKAYGNAIYLSDTEEVTAEKIHGAFTTPSKIHRTDPGIPEHCVVCQLRRVVDPTGYRASWDEDRRGLRGCMDNKSELIRVLNAALAPLRARRRALERDTRTVDRVLKGGAARARAVAQDTLRDVKRALKLA